LRKVILLAAMLAMVLATAAPAFAQRGVAAGPGAALAASGVLINIAPGGDGGNGDGGNGDAGPVLYACIPGLDREEASERTQDTEEAC
jgi:hypothetical protein